MQLSLSSLWNRLRGVRRQEYARYSNQAILQFLPAGLKLTRDQQISVSAAYAAIRAIVDPLAASDWNVVVSENGSRKNLTDSNTHYLLNLRASRNLPAIAAKELVITSAICNGDGYALILRNNANQIIGWEPLDAARITKYWREDETAIGGGRIVYEYALEAGDKVLLNDTEIVDLRGPSIKDLFGGDPILSRATIAIATAAAQEKFGNVYFANGAHLGGYIKYKGRLKTQEDIDRLKATWNEKNSGLDSVGETAVLEEGAEYESLTPDAEKVQLVGPRAFQVEEIARYFGVPLVKLMVKEAATGYGANLSTLNEQFSRDTLTPWSKRIAQEFGFKLLAQRAPWPEIIVNLAWLTRGDAESRARVRQIDIQNGVITRDEARAEEGMTALPGGVGSIPTTTGTVIALTKDALEPKPPVAPPPATVPNDPNGDGIPDDQETPAQQQVQNLFRAGLQLCLQNHRRRWIARSKDVTEEKLPAAREELRAKLANDLHAFGDKRLTDEQFASLASQIEGGVEPEKAMEAVV